MWFLLLVAVSTTEYSADSVYATLEECWAARTTVNDVCATVALTIIELPSVPEIETSALEDQAQPEMGPTA